MTSSDIIGLALKARTVKDAAQVQDLIAEAVGARYQRPVGDRWNNQGLLKASGASYNHKLLEGVTNMQDAVLELLAIQKHGSRTAVPYSTPAEAAADLLYDMTSAEQAKRVAVTLHAATSDGSKRWITVELRDRGCGMTNGQIPLTIFQLGSGHKNGVDWLQGTFGLGGATMYPNADAVVLVSRRDPSLLEPGEADLISVAVVQWEQAQTTTNAFYLVTSKWESARDEATPYSVPAAQYPDFEPGTQLTLISYAVDGLARQSSDEKSFASVFDTRLLQPVTPVAYRNAMVRERVETLRGLWARLDRSPAEAGKDETDTLPFTHAGKTYQLPIRYRLFAKPGAPGARRNFVAHGHALLITSNGQVHSHWTPQQFKIRTKLNKLSDRILVVVQCDALPIEVRAQLFTADRSDTAKIPAAIRLEEEISAFLNEWAALNDANYDLIREAVTSEGKDRSTIEVARKIARALKVKGYTAGGRGSRGGGKRPPKPTPKEDLYDDPTHFEGPESVTIKTGTTKGIYFRINAKDGFLGKGQRGQLTVTCDHPDIGEDEIAVGTLNAGRVRVSVSMPDTEELGKCQLAARVGPWTKKAGGLGTEMSWSTTLEVVDEIEPKPSGKGAAGGKGGKRGSGGGGDLVALVWENSEDAHAVGSIQTLSGSDLADMRPGDYAELKGVTDEIPTVVLNNLYSPLKAYVHGRAAALTDEATERAKERYAVGVGVALLMLDQHVKKQSKEGKEADEEGTEEAQRAAARGILSVLPDYDQLAKEMED